jgi:hypothetical protein
VIWDLDEVVLSLFSDFLMLVNDSSCAFLTLDDIVVESGDATVVLVLPGAGRL